MLQSTFQVFEFILLSSCRNTFKDGSSSGVGVKNLINFVHFIDKIVRFIGNMKKIFLHLSA